jgi:opacity protein-like surface antigen
MSIRRVLACMVLCAAAKVGCAADSGFYFGVNGGQAEYDFARPDIGLISFGAPPLAAIAPSLNPIAGPPAFGVGAESFIAIPIEAFWFPGEDEKATSWSGLVGYRIFRYAAIELAYQDLGTLHEYSPPRQGIFFAVPEVKRELESSGATLSVLGQLPIIGGWSVLLRAGGLFVDQDVTIRSGSNAFTDSLDSEAFLYGIGTQFDFGSHWTARLDFQHYDDVGKGHGIGEADVDVLSLGVIFRLTSQ